MEDISHDTPIFNDNQGCVNWCKNVCTKGMRHINLRECAVRESVADGDLTVIHVDGKLNPADLFTKELRDGSHFRKLRDSFMNTVHSFMRRYAAPAA